MAGSLIASCLLIAACCLFSQLIRVIVDKNVSTPLSKLLFLEFVASAELCAACFELIVVAEEYGIWVYAVILFLLTLWWAAHWGDSAACPYIHLEAYLDGSISFSHAFLVSLAEIAGGLAIYRYVQYTWDLQLSVHNKSVWDCDADLHVSAFHGALVEGVATFLCRIVSRTIAELEPRFGTALDAFVGTSLVVAACDYSGGYFNPVLATSLKLNCRGNTFAEHFIVYWIGSIAGSFLSWWTYPIVQGSLFPRQAINKKYQ
ncbi:aquaporin-11-like [Daphnia carinata]|uniref:aquaporin-11-like n=1 Tax=Daphnia carinata TaxID=120202 RepID=UPI00257D531D|nr:aquaporin-11-like [Daphnia carinata]